MINTFLSSSFVSFVFAVIYAVTIILIVVAVAFFTVLERKVLSAVQRRRGPNVAGIWGFLQALSDGSKLLAKEPVFVSGANYYIFLFAPIMLLTMSLTLWVFIPLPGYQFGVSVSYSFIVVFLFSALNSYAIILAGIVSNSRYSLIGGLRAIAQLISYEIPLSVSLLTLFCIQGSYNLYEFAGSKLLYAAIALPSIVIFAISLLAETNRTPFDLPEAEAELVAGYNLEYSSILFSLFFLAEYSNILLAASLLSLLFFSGAWFYLGVIGFCLITVYVRATLPRFTFYQLINLCWKTMFPASLIMLMFTILVMFFFNHNPAAYLNNDIIDLIQTLTGDNSLSSSTDHSTSHKDSSAVCWRGQGELFYLPFLSIYIMTPGFYNGRLAAFLKGAAPSAVDDLHSVYFQECHGSLGNASKIFIFFVVALLVVCALVGLNWVVINYKANNKKNSPYECGFEPYGSPVSDFTPNFTAVALIFLIYDVEVLLTFPWAYSAVGHTAYAVITFFFFILLMLLGLAYEVMDDSFNVV